MSDASRQRRSTKLRAQYRAIAAYLGLTLGFAGGVMLTPLLVLIAWPEESIYSGHFLVPGLLLGALGALAFFRLRPRDAILTVQDGGPIVVLSWIAVCLLSTWPLMAIEGLSFTQAVFECVSGWTTTGLSVVDVTKAAKITLIWRSIMQLVGGAGFAILMVAALTGYLGTGLPSAEGRSEQLVPHVRQSAKLVLLIYSAYITLGTVAYILVGVNWFDAINHAFAAVSTGGFSTWPESIGHWDSVAVEAVTIALMLLGSLNFLTAYLLWQGRVGVLWKDSEVRLVALFVPLVAALLLLLVCLRLYATHGMGKNLRVAIFETVSCMTTTGFSTVPYSNWNAFGILMLIAFMVVGGGTNSTAGGMKQYRVVILSSAILWEIRRGLLPGSAVLENAAWHSGRRDYIDDARIRQTTAFAAIYMITLVIGTSILAAHGNSLPESLFEFASAQGTVGLSIGVTGPNTPGPVLWAEIVGMFLGRLEFLIVFVGLSKMIRDFPLLLK